MALLVLALVPVVAVDRSDDDAGLAAEAAVAIADVVLLGSLLTCLARTSPGWMRTVGAGAALAFGLSLVIYLAPPEIAGRADFQFRAVVALALACGVVFVAKVREGRSHDWLLGMVLGVLGPPALVLALLTAVCAGRSECI